MKSPLFYALSGIGENMLATFFNMIYEIILEKVATIFNLPMGNSFLLQIPKNSAYEKGNSFLPRFGKKIHQLSERMTKRFLLLIKFHCLAREKGFISLSTEN